MAEESAKETLVERNIYSEIASCFSQEKLDLFLKERGGDIPVQELLDFLKKQLVTEEFEKQWKYNSDFSKFEGRSLNMAFIQTIANSLVHLNAEAVLRLEFGENFYPEETEETVQKIKDYSSLLHKFVITEDFKEKADSFFSPDPLKV